ncbi:thiol reductant ABC exporter subunit CydC [Nocardia sp. NPDC049220]|uniref:thiol reductant ABC exporter subunit CydC n=1 Tax=Nocardia sp. NPDC049220 TaxID=3155273 RepID=UPI0033C4E00D
MWALLELSGWQVTVAIAWGVVALGSGLGLAALAAWLIARAWQMPPVLDLSIAVVTVRALGIARGLCRYLERLATHDVALRAMTSARTTVYRTLARSDFWLLRPVSSSNAADRLSGCADQSAPDDLRTGGADRSGSAGRTPPRRGDLLVRVGSDIDDLGAVVVRVFVPVVVALVLAVAAVGLLATISTGAAVILAGTLALSGLVGPWWSARAARDAEHAVRADRAEFTARALTVLDHASELRVAGRLDVALAAAADSSRRAVAAEDTAATRSAWAAAATPLSIGVSALGALLIGITRYGPDGGTAGAMTPMALVVLVLLPLSAFEAVAALPAAAQALTTARAALHRLVRFEGEPTAHDVSLIGSLWSGRSRSAGVGSNSGIDTARVPRLSEGCQAGVVGAPDSSTGTVTFSAVPELPEGRRIAVVGPSGAGKTTLLMAWAGLFGSPRRDVTFFAEDAHLFGTSVLENLRVARGDLVEDEAESALRAVGLGDWLDALPDGVHTDLIGGAAAVSGGQRRRILLARALVAPARGLLLDEPTEHLEADAGDQVLRDLLDAESGLVGPDRIVVVVTHHLPPDHRADAVVQVDASGLVTTVFPAKGAHVCAHREITLPSL